MPIPLVASGATHVGKVRVRNEDSFIVDVRNEIFLVSDGIGGHPGGDVASKLAVETAYRFLLAKREMKPAFEAADQALLALGRDRSDLLGLGATLVGLAFEPTRTRTGTRMAWIGNAGDSRIYVRRSGQLKPLTSDHSSGPFLANAIGMLEYVDVISHEFLPGDEILLCTDGLTNAVGDASIAKELRGKPKRDADALIENALWAGGPDNVTVVAVVV